MIQDPLPKRVRVLVLGGGIHGVGVLHDLVSRDWKDVHLVEKTELGNGTSSRSTKLIHGGLRYLKNLGQVSLVSESLRERNFLLKQLPSLVKPIEFILPVEKNRFFHSLYLRLGLKLYDFLSGKRKVNPYKSLDSSEVESKTPILAKEKFRNFLSFWDAQVDDLALVRRIAQSARYLGAGITEHCPVVDIKVDRDGWIVSVKDKNGQIQTISAYYVVNCLGPWSHFLLEKTQLKPLIGGVNNKGTHILVRDLGLKAGLFLESPIDQRVVFMIPWQGYTLLGTTEEVYEGDPDLNRPTDKEVDYILASANHFLKTPLQKENILKVFSGLRWLADTSSSNISRMSRESVLTEHLGEKGLLISVYGGKLTSYRALAEKVGDRITGHFGDFQPSQTLKSKSWALNADLHESAPDILERF